MALNQDSKIREIKESEDAISIIAKYIPGFDPFSPKMKMTQGMTLKTICGFPQTGISKEDAQKLYEELEAANL